MPRLPEIRPFLGLFQKERRLVDQAVVFKIAAQIRAVGVLPDNCLPNHALNVGVAGEEITG